MKRLELYYDDHGIVHGRWRDNRATENTVQVALCASISAITRCTARRGTYPTCVLCIVILDSLGGFARFI